jgi:hypothetical protein
MTNTTQMMMLQQTTMFDATRKARTTMDAWTTQRLGTVATRTQERFDEAANERLARLAHGAEPNDGIRRQFGNLLIHTGRRIAGETSPTAPAAVQPTRALSA